MRRLLLIAGLTLGLAAPAHAAPFTVGTGEHPGVAIDDGGTAYVAWQVNLGQPGDGVQLCVVPPKARSCASSITLGFPGYGYGRSRASVLLPAPNTVDVITPRFVTPLEQATFLSRSTDGGRSFAAPVKLSSDGFDQAAAGPAGRVALVAGPAYLNVDSAPADGSGAAADGASLGEFLKAQFNDIATQGPDVIAAGSDPGSTQAFRLPGGANPDDEAAWQALPGLPLGRQPELAGGPAGLVVLLEPAGSAPRSLFAQRFDGAGWSAPVSVFGDAGNNDFKLTQNGRGRLSATLTDGLEYHLEYVTSTDGGVLWSSAVTVARYGRPYPSDLEMATAADGRGVAVVASSLGDHAIRLARFSPRSAPTAARRFGSARVQVRSLCDGSELSVVVEAARGGARISPSAVLRPASFGRARGARRESRQRFRARYDLRRSRARIPVRLRPRSGRARTLTLPVRRCGSTG